MNVCIGASHSINRDVLFIPELFGCIRSIILNHMLRSIAKSISRFSTEVQKSSSKPSSTAGLTYYKDGQLVNRTALTLKKQEDIESYVVKTVQNYFRTTYKQGTHELSKAWARTVPYLSTGWTLSTRLRSRCRLNRISGILFLLRPCLPSPRSTTTSPTLSRSKPSKGKVIRILYHDNITTLFWRTVFTVFI